MSSSVVDPKKCAVVVIDMANDFVYPGGVLAEAGGPEYQEKAKGVIEPIRRLIDAARESGATVVYATDCHDEGDAELKKWPPHSMRGTHGGEIVPDLTPQAGDVVLEKQTYSAFQSTNLDEILKEKGIETLYVTGLHTDCCVRHTSGDAFQRGFEMVWVTDTLQAFTEEAHQAGLDYFKAWYAIDPDRQFKTSDEVAAEWHSASTASTTG